ncbi:MAG: [FeFe] hydrogenase, group A [Candidatus Izimaplasma sp.]|nr:[FeFe] hydrogenase, group A [Candidatus Izimaplasma bacterium]
MATITMNNQQLEVTNEMTILEAAKAHNINIPTLCHYPDLAINSDCRICVVEIEGKRMLPTSCSTPVQDGMVIYTNSPRVLQARKTITELMLSSHDANCTACTRNMRCELQTLSKNLGIDINRFEPTYKDLPIDDNNPSLVRNMNRCIKCGRCVDVCKTVQGVHVLERMGRSNEMMIAPAFNQSLNNLICTYCGQCANVCPVGAIMEKDDTDLVWENLHNPKKRTLVQVAPAVRVAIGESFHSLDDTVPIGKLVSALKHLGFDEVYDTNFTADLTIMEEGNELIYRIQNDDVLPMMTSCCPGWINYVEQHHSDILKHISSCKSPQQMFGALAKNYYKEQENLNKEDIFVVSIMPCTAKKYEAKREEFTDQYDNPDVDVVLTTRELEKMFRQMGVDFDQLDNRDFDEPFGMTSGAAQLFGASGGVMEAALRTVTEVLSGKPLKSLDFSAVRGMDGIKEASFNLKGQEIKVAVSHSLSNAEQLIQGIKDGTSPYTFIEIMACPGGCIGGGGQPYGTDSASRLKRMETTYRVDLEKDIRKSHDNPAIKTLYDNYLQKPLSELSHHLLHTRYYPR